MIPPAPISHQKKLTGSDIARSISRIKSGWKIKTP
jgi:hypothetical protein